MKLAMLVLAVALVLGGLVGVLMARDPGYVLIVYQDVAVETSLWLALVLLLLAYLAFRLVAWVLSRLRGGGGSLSGWNQRRIDRAARDHTVRGLLVMAEGRWPEARKLLEGAADRVDAPLINYLNAARAAQEMGDTAGRDALLRAAGESTPGAKFAVGLTQAELQRAQGQWEQSLATLLELRRQSPRHGQVLRMLMDCYRELRDWQAMLELLDDLKKHAAVDAQTLHELALTAWHGRIEQGPGPIAELWKSVPKELRREPALVAQVARAMAAGGAVDDAEATVRGALEQSWNPDLVRLYGTLVSADPAAQLGVAERWLKSHPDDPELRLTLGRICLMNRRWARAREHLESSLALRRSAAAEAELGRLCIALGELERGASLLVTSLEKLPALPLPERGDGISAAERS